MAKSVRPPRRAHSTSRMKRSRRPLAERLDPSRLEAPGPADAPDRILWPLVVVMIVSLSAAGLFALLLQG